MTFSFCFYELGETATYLGLEGVDSCVSIPYVDGLHLAALAGQLGLELARGNLWGALLLRPPRRGSWGAAGVRAGLGWSQSLGSAEAKAALVG